MISRFNSPKPVQRLDSEPSRTQLNLHACFFLYLLNWQNFTVSIKILKKIHFCILTLELLGNNIFFLDGRLLIFFLNYVYLGWEEIQMYFGYPSMHWLVLKNRLRGGCSPPLRFAPLQGMSYTSQHPFGFRLIVLSLA